ncbi:hypothetical protein [uncultured Paludibaculum sp.]|uniref:hypothetical protein n=1 Tax=uncultured Paludibaculum sp. TaxID=1765020 RepID=UPI002AAAA79D|nr:hypothetical protein [uncultured Paludibaculum sp.]
MAPKPDKAAQLDKPLPEVVDTSPPQSSTVLFIIGSALFLVSFLLPAVHVANSDLRGWVCAQVTLFSIAEPTEMDPLAFGSRLLNVVVLFYCGARLTDSAPRARRFLLYAAFACLILTWVLFSHESIRPLIGHYLWAAGALLITGWEGVDATKEIFLRR